MTWKWAIDIAVRVLSALLPVLTPEIKKLVEENGLHWEATVRDLQGIPRVLIARK